MRKSSLIFFVVIFSFTLTSTMGVKRTATHDDSFDETIKTSRTEKLRAKKVNSGLQYAETDDIELVKGKGSKERGGGKGGFFWRIKYQTKPAGKVFINWINEAPLGDHASIQIFLNKQSQGKHIGRFAYRKACELSSYDEVYAHMSKTNVASRKAAEAAGFVIFSKVGQLIMKWVRK